MEINGVIGTMLHTKKELAIDYIGNQTPLTQAEEQALQLFFRQKKNKTVVTKPKQVVKKGIVSK